MARRLAAAMVATFGLLSVLAMPPVAAQNDETTTTTATTDQSTASAVVSTAAEGDGGSKTGASSGAAADASAEAEPATVTVIAKRGDRGAAVRTLQTRLAAAGFSPGVIDGIFGRLTEGALISFQTAVGLEPDRSLRFGDRREAGIVQAAGRLRLRFLVDHHVDP